MKQDIVLEDRLRAAADHIERMAARSGPEMTVQELAPEVVVLLREAADGYQSASEYRDSWTRIRGTEMKGTEMRDQGRPQEPGSASCRRESASETLQETRRGSTSWRGRRASSGTGAEWSDRARTMGMGGLRHSGGRRTRQFSH